MTTARDRAIKRWSRGDLVVAWLLKNDLVPITRETYLIACMLTEPLDPEVEAELPDFLQQRTIDPPPAPHESGVRLKMRNFKLVEGQAADSSRLRTISPDRAARP